MTTSPDPMAHHVARVEVLGSELARLRAVQARIVAGRLLTFGGAVLAGVLAFTSLGAAGGALVATCVAAVCAGAFFALVIVDARTASVVARLEAQRRTHERHLERLAGTWTRHPVPGLHGYAPEHPYAWDIDVAGQGSLLQFLDTTHTVEGERCLSAWLGAPAEPEEVRARQAAVRELAALGDFRESFEAALARPAGKGKISGAPFLEFVRMASPFAARPWLRPVTLALPAMTVGAALLAAFGLAPAGAWMLGALVQAAFALVAGGAAAHAFELVAARRGYIDALYAAFCVVERTPFESVKLRALRERFFIGGQAPSAHFRSLDRWTSLAEMRSQFPLHLVLNGLVLWDFQVLHGLLRWNARAGGGLEALFGALAELEALSALATLHALDPSTTFPDIEPGAPRFEAEALAHPLLAPRERVPNDVALSGEGALLIVTGSNMAGKSTLLRAVGLNAALALAGGPVTAARLRVSPVRLRASMRAMDSLERGASYFHAELTKLRTVVADAEASPPILFLLDELLRGTNADARHRGARAVVEHLLHRRALGFVATHDVALAALEGAPGARVQNAHFTDTMVDGEMTFDYRLRPGVVRSSNALRLLKLAGIDVPEPT